MYVFTGDNPTKMYYDAIQTIMSEGNNVSPRGKEVLEITPAAMEFTNPLNRQTFLGSRRVNPFFQIAESLWILSGRADVAWLLPFNANMGQFSDDGIWFNAPYGERIRTWNKNSAHDVVINPIDQLQDAYIKLSADKDTRQAVIVISNPMFDNSRYTIGEKGKDIACNLVITFKIRDDKLRMMVMNRSNDLHWGLMGANLCQFSTIQEVLAGWLNVGVGQYTHVTDSLHIYLNDYGAKVNDDVLEYYKNNDPSDTEVNFKFLDEPRMNMDKEQFDRFLGLFWGTITEYLQSDEFIMSVDNMNIIQYLDEKTTDENSEVYIDPYWNYAIKSMFAYRMVKLGKITDAMTIMSSLPSCRWKVSQLYFLQSFLNREGTDKDKDLYNSCVSKIMDDLDNPDDKAVEVMEKYLV